MFQKSIVRVVLAFAVVAMMTVVPSALAQPNVLVNGGFETNPPPAGSFGNHIPFPIPPWVLGTGQAANVVKVDGPGGYDYFNLGPESDASAPGAGVEQHYLDIANGENDFYQSFTPRCSGLAEFGGYFSTRANTGGTASVTIHEGIGTTGTVVGMTNLVSLAGGTSRTDPWTLVSFSAALSASQTYSFVVHMTDNLNFDDAFVRYPENCQPPDPCCPPWNSSTLEEMMVYSGTGGIAAPYTLKFQPTPIFSAQMQSYINYLHTVNPAITMITIQFRLHDGGNGATATMGTQMGVSHYITWTAGATSPSPPPTFFSGPSETQLVNHWYLVHTGIYLEGGQTFFGDNCANNDIGVRVQVQTLNALRPVGILQKLTPGGRVAEKLLN